MVGATLRCLLLAFIPVPVAATATPLQLTASDADRAEVVSCDVALPSACVWRFTGRVSGTPFGDDPMVAVMETQTTGVWDDEGCQDALSDVRFFHEGHRLRPLGWMLQGTNGRYCAFGTFHWYSGTFEVVPDGPPGRYQDIVWSGQVQSSNGAGNTPGAHGHWKADFDGVLDHRAYS